MNRDGCGAVRDANVVLCPYESDMAAGRGVLCRFVICLVVSAVSAHSFSILQE